MWHLYTVDLCDYTQLVRQVMVGTVLKSTYEPHGGRPNGPKRCLELPRLLVARAQLVARLPIGIADPTHRLAGFFSPALALFAGEDLRSRGGFASAEL